jgi:hypothetical protein
MATESKRPPKGEGTLVVDLGQKLKRKLEDEAVKRSRRSGAKVYQTDIARRAIEKELGLNSKP